MCNECHCNDDRKAEQDLAIAEAKGQFHRVTIRVTVEHTVDIPGATHETDDITNFLGDVVESGEVVDWEEV